MLFIGVFMIMAMAMRLVLLLAHAGTVSWTVGLLAAFFWGVVFDLGAALLAALPLIALLTVLPAGWGKKTWQRALMQLGAVGIFYVLLFSSCAEWLFWDEFGVRFNFIAVDYLVYTTEVVGNIRESYNLPLILGGVGTVAVLLTLALNATGGMRRWFDALPEPTGRRWKAGAIWFVVGLSPAFLLNQVQTIPAFADNYQRELAKNGTWSFFAAFRNNELDYEQFYPVLPVADSFARIRKDLTQDGAKLMKPQELDTLRYINNTGPEQHLNVIQITVESLSAKFLGSFNPESTLTPHLDALAPQSLFFTQLYATGTRTVRGMEATTLSLPPTPGRSIVKRPRNGNMFTLGSVFRSRGYDTAFIYSGYGYFDNMNAYFGANGYRIVDRASVDKTDITFANAWGACDEDLFRWTLREADNDAAAGKPFHFFVMTTSNHRPFTYPDGRIDLPSKVSGRDGGVKYTDYAINQFLQEAAKKPWFKNTVFVIVADHCAESAGRTELPVQNYHIPLFIYAPGGQIAPGRVDTRMSQIDLPPTLLSLMGWSYPSRFYGRDVLKTKGEPRALIGNYQRLGLYRDSEVNVLKPLRQSSQFRYDPASFALTPLTTEDEDMRIDTIAYYQTASYLYEHNAYRELTPEELRAGPPKE